MYYCYILRCCDNSLYCGITNNVKNRITEHNLGKGSKFVRSRLPATLVYVEEYPDISSALKREITIKKMTKKNKEALIAV